MALLFVTAVVLSTIVAFAVKLASANQDDDLDPNNRL
jgi:hypothetical protein